MTEPQDPAAWAAAEQMTMKFRDLTSRLVELLDETVECTDPDRLSELHVQTAQTLGDAMQEGGDDSVLNYVMFLVSVASESRRQSLAIGVLINRMANNLEDMGATIGMIPMVADSKHDDQDRGEPDFITG